MFHPRAFLSHKRNVRLGLEARTRILQILEKRTSDVKTIESVGGLRYNVVLHHLHLLADESVVLRKGEKKPFAWELTGVGQQRLSNSSKQ